MSVVLQTLHCKCSILGMKGHVEVEINYVTKLVLIIVGLLSLIELAFGVS